MLKITNLNEEKNCVSELGFELTSPQFTQNPRKLDLNTRTTGLSRLLLQKRVKLVF